MMCQTAKKTSDWYLHTHKEDKELTVEEIHEMIEEVMLLALLKECLMLVPNLQDPNHSGKVLKKFLLQKFDHQTQEALMSFLPAVLQISNGLIYISICLIMIQMLLKMLHHIVLE